MKILIIRVSSLGDVLHNMPMVQDLKQCFPDAQIDWVVEESFVHLVQLNQNVHRIIPYALRRWKKSLLTKQTRAEMKVFKTQLQQETYDLVLETQGLMKTGIIMWLAKTTPQGRKIGLANGTEGSGYEPLSRLFHDESVKVDHHTHAVLRSRLVAAHAGKFHIQTPANFGLTRLQHQPEWTWYTSKPYIVFFHGTAGASKKWGRENWASCARDCADPAKPCASWEILLPWGSETERLEAEEMAKLIPQSRVLPKLSMSEAIFLAQEAHLAIGVDTGLTHIAAAYETPTIEIYGDSPRWKTEGNWSKKIINVGDKGKPASVAEVEIAMTELFNNV